MTEHPCAIRLEELAAGEGDDGARRHVQGCAECREYVEQCRAGAEQFAQTEGASAEKFVTAVKLRSVATFRSGWRKVVWLAGPIAAAASLLLYLWMPATPRPGHAPTVVTFATPIPSASRFKGRAQLAVIRERAGTQHRSTDSVSVRPGDRLRVEVGVDVPQLIEAGILGRDGQWVELLAPRLLPQGTHFSEQSVRFDNAPSDGWVVVGPPDAVKAARETQDFGSVAVVRVVVDSQP